MRLEGGGNGLIYLQLQDKTFEMINIKFEVRTNYNCIKRKINLV